jgi:hypothetical protein
MIDDYSQVAINNINIVLKLIKLRLDTCHREYDVYTTDQLVEFANQALSRFNSILPFTNFAWDDTAFLEKHYSDLAEFAACLLMREILEIKIGLKKKAIY